MPRPKEYPPILPATRRERVAAVLFLVVTLGSALSLGSLHTAWLCVWSGLATVTLGVLYAGAAPLPLRPAARVLLVVAIGLAAYTALTLLPLPASILARLASDNADVWSRALTPLNEAGPAAAPLSLDPSATRVQLLRGLFYVVVLFCALRIAATREGSCFLERTLVLSAVVMALAALAHPATGATRVFGAYEPLEPSMYGDLHIAPLLNGNHLAAYVNVGFLVAVSSILRTRHPIMPRPLAAGAAALLLGTSFFTSSRGGVAAALIAVVALFVIALLSRQSPRKTIVGTGVLLFMGLGGAALATTALNGEYLEKMAGGDLSKLHLIVNAFDLVKKSPVFGVGRGAFESVFPSVREGMGLGTNFVFTHPENLIAQFCSEWGVPVTLLSLAAMGYALQPRTVLGRSLPPLGAWAALVMAAIHNMVDFNVEVPGVVCLFTICAAICVAGSAGAKPGVSTSMRSLVPLTLAGVTLVVGVWAFAGREGELGPDQRALRALAIDHTRDKSAFHVAARAAMLRHPAAPFLPYLGELRASVARDESVIPWASRALERSPLFGRVHLLLARSLYARAGQARLEYKLAYAEDGALADFARECLPLVNGFDDAMELVPDGPAGAPLLQQLADALETQLPATAVRLDEELLRRDPTATSPLMHALTADLHDVREREPWCAEDRAQCVREAEARADHLVGTRPEQCRAWELRSQLLLASGEPKRAFEDLAAAVDKADERTSCAKACVSLSMTMGQPLYVEQAVERLAKIGCATTEECKATMVFIAEVEHANRNDRRAIFYYKRALEMAPGEASYLVAIAQIAEQHNLHGEAADAYGKLATLDPKDPSWAEKQRLHVEAVRNGAMQDVVSPSP